MQKRVNKSKGEILSEYHQREDAERRRMLISDTVFPYLVSMDDNIGYTKVFLQAMSGLINGEFDETRKTTTIGDIKERIVNKLDSIFTKSNPTQKKEYDRYMGLVEKLNDVSIQDFTYAAELPRYIDGYITKTKDKESISIIDIKEILG